jgi:spore germination protein YaaH
MKVGTEDGYIGYVKTNTLKKSQIEVTSREFEEPVYTNLSMDRTVNLAWHNVESEYANDYILETIADTKGLTVISPTWFTLSDVNGNITSIASAEYVSSAHQNNLSVWAVIRDFHGGINTYDETYQVLSYTSRRENLINQLMAEVLRTGIDGINVDFELVSKDAGEHFTQFLRELSVKCRQNGIVLSVDNYVPMSYNEHYDLEEQGEVVDYVIIMGYDEHVDGSYEAGSVASYGYVKDGIEQSLEKVPASKLINAVPFYTRLWTETYKTQAELDAQAGTEAANYEKNVSSIAMGMDAVQELLESSGVTTQWDDEAKQYYAQWSVGDETYKIWVEDATSIEEKLKLMKQYNLAGVAAWRIGWETYSIWDLILQYVN